MKISPRFVKLLGLLIVAAASLVIGNSFFTLVLYFVGKPEMTAWTGHVAQSSPSAINDLFLALIGLVIGILLLRR